MKSYVNSGVDMGTIVPPAQGHHSTNHLHAYCFESTRNKVLVLIFVALSFADFFMTYLLLKSSPHYYESNPVAQWFFSNWNILGMMIYKVSIMAVVVTLCEVIERKRHGWGAVVLGIGCAATGYAFARGLNFWVGLS